MLKQRLLRGYDTTSRPVRRDSSPVDTSVGMSLFHILDTSERHQTISAQVSVRVHWWDEYLTWSVEDFPIQRFWIPAKSIWRPDLIITNYANDEYSDYMNTNAIVEKNGKIMWTFPMVVKMYCTLDVRYFPFDSQDCNVTFVSWTYDGFQVALNHTGRDDQKVYYNARNQEWKVTGISPRQELIKYPCCKSPFPVIHFTIHMYRRCLFYVINLICPCLLIYFVSFLGFYLPIESGEKVNLEITVLLALVVFLLMVSETMPPTPDAIPILGLLFTVTMTMVALAVVMSVIVTRVFFADQHHQHQQEEHQQGLHQRRHRLPSYIVWLAKLHRRWTGSSLGKSKNATTATGAVALESRCSLGQQHEQATRRRWAEATDSSNSPLKSPVQQPPTLPSTYFKLGQQGSRSPRSPLSVGLLRGSRRWRRRRLQKLVHHVVDVHLLMLAASSRAEAATAQHPDENQPRLRRWQQPFAQVLPHRPGLRVCGLYELRL
uniref:Neur_chan_LBD domain-containing protein n=1 Tax=Macrostomum lignano TaxID=282301 RepID=A0A1I8H4D2_9PLAT